MLLQLADQPPGGEAEHPRVPEKTAAIKILLRSDLIRLLDETHYPTTTTFIQSLSSLDITKAGFWRGRANSVGDQIALSSQRYGLLGSNLEPGQIMDQVIGGHYHHYRIVTLLFGQYQSSHGKCRCGIATLRLQQKARLVMAKLGTGEMITALEVVFTVGHRNNFTTLGNQTGGAQVGFLEQRLTTR
ncbi:hypothetical protein D3C71_1194580 [compost metagenome]